MFWKLKIIVPNVFQRNKIAFKSTYQCLWIFPHKEDSCVLESEILCILYRSEQTYFPWEYVLILNIFSKKKKKKLFQHDIKVNPNDSRSRNLVLLRPAFYGESFERWVSWLWIIVLVYIIYLECHLRLSPAFSIKVENVVTAGNLLPFFLF